LLWQIHMSCQRALPTGSMEPSQQTKLRGFATLYCHFYLFITETSSCSWRLPDHVQMQYGIRNDKTGTFRECLPQMQKIENMKNLNMKNLNTDCFMHLHGQKSRISCTPTPYVLGQICETHIDLSSSTSPENVNYPTNNQSNAANDNTNNYIH
jgi:hypothetical protein